MRTDKEIESKMNNIEGKTADSRNYIKYSIIVFAVLLISAFLSIVFHEVLGHLTFYTLSGVEPRGFIVTFAHGGALLNPPPDLLKVAQFSGLVAGIAMNLFLGLLFLRFFFKIKERDSLFLRLFLLVLSFFNLGLAFQYLVADFRSGDVFQMSHLTPHPIIFRIVCAVVGLMIGIAILYIFIREFLGIGRDYFSLSNKKKIYKFLFATLVMPLLVYDILLIGHWDKFYSIVAFALIILVWGAFFKLSETSPRRIPVKDVLRSWSVAVPIVIIALFTSKGIMWAEHKDHDDWPLERYVKAVTLYPYEPLNWNNLGYKYLQLENYEKAIESIQKYIDLSPEEANAYDSMGEMYFEKGDLEKSEEYYLKALSLDDRFANSYYMLARLYEKIGEENKAVTFYKNFLQTRGYRYREKAKEAEERLKALEPSDTLMTE